MHEKEILFFTEALQSAKDTFYFDAIEKFQKLVNEFPNSDLADDAMYNIGLCYYEINQFQKCIEVLEEMIKQFPDATITAIENGDEFGKTAAKAYYLIVQCNIGLNDIQKAESYIPILENYTKTYIAKDQDKFSFAELAKGAIKIFVELKKGNENG